MMRTQQMDVDGRGSEICFYQFYAVYGEEIHVKSPRGKTNEMR